jgi:hypothetical protein
MTMVLLPGDTGRTPAETEEAIRKLADLISATASAPMTRAAALRAATSMFCAPTPFAVAPVDGPTRSAR